MIIGIPKEIKDNEYRVAQTPGGVELLVQHGHRVLVQAGAGEGSGFSDEEYRKAGAEILPDAASVWNQADMVTKVKEPLPQEYPFLRPGLILFTYLHLAAEERLTHELMKKEVIAIAYETVELDDGRLPLLIPMSEVAGRMAVQIGAYYLEKPQGGRGKLLSGIPGVRPADVAIIDTNLDRLRYLDDVLHGNLTTLASNPRNIADSVRVADLVIGAVLIPGARAPRLVTRELVRQMKPGSVIVDVAVDQGGCVETIRPTTHSNPVYVVDGVIHYGVTNMPGAVPRTSTYGLSNATLPYALLLADLGFEEAVAQNKALARGVNVYKGRITHPAVAEAFGLEYTPLEKLL